MSDKLERQRFEACTDQFGVFYEHRVFSMISVKFLIEFNVNINLRQNFEVL
jgi:hypothetical protein